MILIASICFSGFFKICYMRNKKKDETKLLIKETQKHEQLNILDMLKNMGYIENKQNSNVMCLWSVAAWVSGQAPAHDSFSLPSLHHSLAEWIQ